MCTNIFYAFKAPRHPNSLPPGLSPPTRDVGHPMSMSMDFGQVYGLRAGRNQKGRPMVWETHKVCNKTNHICLSTYPIAYSCQKCVRTQLSHSHPPPNPSHPLMDMPPQTLAAAGMSLDPQVLFEIN
jgi:hypothetical protein